MFPASLLVRVAVGAAAAIWSLRFGTGLYFWRVAESVERPSYEIIAKLSGGVEIRLYEPYLIAETVVDGGSFRDSTGEGFRKCAGYIFGKNKKKAQRWFSSSLLSASTDESEKMAMTAPVRFAGDSSTDGSSGRKVRVSFVIGKGYTTKTAPQPLDRNIKIRQIPAHMLAVKSFSGPPPKDERVQAEREKIEIALARDGRPVPDPNEETLVYGYHDPFLTPGFLRRNEVSVVVARQGL